MTMFPKPKDLPKKKSTGIKNKKDGREVLSDAKWKQRRWELYVLVGDLGGWSCFRCGCKLDFLNNFHAHHSRGTRGIGGGYRDDRIFLPGVFSEALWEDYPYMPEPQAGLVWNLYALCNNCHMDKEHDQGCEGKPQWGLFKDGESTCDTTDAGVPEGHGNDR